MNREALTPEKPYLVVEEQEPDGGGLRVEAEPQKVQRAPDVHPMSPLPVLLGLAGEDRSEVEQVRGREPVEQLLDRVLLQQVELDRFEAKRASFVG